jgi:hypothetical protein
MMNSSRSDAAGWICKPSTITDGTMSKNSASNTQRHLASTLLFSLKNDPSNLLKINELPSGGSRGLNLMFV